MESFTDMSYLQNQIQHKNSVPMAPWAALRSAQFTPLQASDRVYPICIFSGYAVFPFAANRPAVLDVKDDIEQNSSPGESSLAP